MGELSDLIPQGAGEILEVDFRALRQWQAAQVFLREALGQDGMDDFFERVEVNRRSVDRCVFATFPSGYVLVVAGRFDAEDVVRRAGKRMHEVRISKDVPLVRRGGWFGPDRYDLVVLRAGHFVVTTGGDEALKAVLDQVRRGRFADGVKKAVSDGLLARAGRAPVRLFVPEPLKVPLHTSVGSLLRFQRALWATLIPVPGQRSSLGLRVVLEGRFAPNSEENFRRLVSFLSHHGFGVSLGLQHSLSTLSVRRTDAAVHMSMSLDAARTGRGVRLLVKGGMMDLIGLAFP